MTGKIPAVPSGTGDAGRRLWRSVLTNFDLETHELALLKQAVRTLDVIDDLDRIAARDGSVVASPQGVKAHPAVVEARQQRIALARLLAALRVPLGDEESKSTTARPPHRGVRGVYAIKGGAAS